MASIVKPLQEIFQPAKPYTDVVRVIEDLRQVNRFLGVDTTEEFLKRFDVTKYDIAPSQIKDVVFIDMKDLFVILTGRQPAFNQCKMYYERFAKKLLLSLAQLRCVLEEIAQPEQTQSLVYLAWNYQLYYQLSNLPKTNQNKSILAQILQLYVADEFFDGSVSTFATKIGQFLHKWRLILNKNNEQQRLITVLSERLGSDINLDLNNSNPRQDANLGQFDFSDQKLICELVQNQVVREGQVCFTEAFDYLILFAVQIKQELHITGKDLCLDVLLLNKFKDSIFLLCDRMKPIESTAEFIQLLGFLLCGDLCFQDEHAALLLFKSAFDQCKMIYAHHMNQPNQFTMNQILQSFNAEVVDVRPVHCQFQNKKLKQMLEINFEASNEDIFNKILYTIKYIDTHLQSKSYNLIFALKQYYKYTANYIDDLTQFKSQQSKTNVNQINNELQIKNEGDEELLAFKTLNLNQQLELFGRAFDSEREFIDYFEKMRKRSIQVEAELNKWKQLQLNFKNDLKNVCQQNNKQQLEQSTDIEELIKTGVKINTDASTEGQNLVKQQFSKISKEELERLKQGLDINLLPTVQQNCLQIIIKDILKQEVKKQGKINENFMVEFTQLVNQYLKPVIEEVKAEFDAQIKQKLYTEYNYIKQAQPLTQKRFDEIMSFVHKLKLRELTHTEMLKKVKTSSQFISETGIFQIMCALHWTGVDMTYGDA
ncbi:Conserved_hypothetical protein [Hexamita inflata]|uniref:Uncharacterized protein n=1 Tax=Hexamita inflata TaxID=28002 RepID=A0ABP1HP64_9EUKA